MIDKKDEKLISNMIIICIIISLIFMIFVGYYGNLINNEHFCRKKVYTNYSNTPLSDSDYTLDSSGEYVLQKFYISDPDIIQYSFCFNVNTNSTQGLKYTIIDSEGEEFAESFIFNDSNEVCQSLGNTDFKRDLYLGVRCDTCTSVRELTIKKESLGDNVIQVFNDGVNTVTYKKDTLSYKLIGYKSCKDVLKSLFLWYIFIIISLWVVALILVGYNKFKEMLFNE